MGASFEEHQQVVDSVMRGDASGARNAMINHVRLVGEVSGHFAVESDEDANETDTGPDNENNRTDPSQSVGAEETNT